MEPRAPFERKLNQFRVTKACENNRKKERKKNLSSEGNLVGLDIQMNATRTKKKFTDLGLGELIRLKQLQRKGQPIHKTVRNKQTGDPRGKLLIIFLRFQKRENFLKNT